MMTGRILLAVFLMTAISCAQAAWDAGASLEGYRWTEFPDRATGQPKESGPRFALLLDWTQDGDRGALFAWRARLYGGTVNYDTFLVTTGEPVSTKTDYNGIANEGQMFFREDVGDYKLDLLTGLGWDYWRRSIRSGGDQVENYSILFLRAGLRGGPPGREAGAHAELGIKYPVSSRENAHLDSLGFTSNPLLSPTGLVSGYAELGYRINARFDVIAYYDSWRFGRSPDVRANKPADPAGAYWIVYQPKSNMDALGIKLLYLF